MSYLKVGIKATKTLKTVHRSVFPPELNFSYFLCKSNVLVFCFCFVLFFVFFFIIFLVELVFW